MKIYIHSYIIYSYILIKIFSSNVYFENMERVNSSLCLDKYYKLNLIFIEYIIRMRLNVYSQIWKYTCNINIQNLSESLC